MNKLKIKLYDNNFDHHPNNSSLSSFPGGEIHSKYIEWVRDPNFECDIAFFSDNCLNQVYDCKSKYKFAWLIEPRDLIPSVYEKILDPNLYNQFDKVLTYDKKFLELDSDKFIQYVFGGSWIKSQEQKIYDKTKNVCIIASHKTRLEGHRLRHQVISELASKHNVDVYGNGYRRFDQTIDILKDYRYCIVIENTKTSGYWVTEKLIQCFRVGTVPLYWGHEFNTKIPFLDKYGMFRFNSVEELDRLLPMLTEEFYNHMKTENEIQTNFKVAEEFTVCEDYIYNNILVPYLHEDVIFPMSEKED